MTIVGRFLSGTYTVTRYAAGTYTNGIYVAGAPTTSTMKGSLQPTNARELKLPEEGARLKQYWKFYSDAPLLVITTSNKAKADKVTIDGETYKVISTEKWLGWGLSYYRAILEREPQQ